MRSLIVYTLVISAAVIAVKAGGYLSANYTPAAAAAEAAPLSSHARSAQEIRLELFTGGTGAPVLARTIVVRKQATIDIGGDSTSITPADWAGIERALTGIPRGMLRAQPAAAAVAASGGDRLAITGGGETWWVATSGWKASPVDAVKEAIWKIVRARWRPARKRVPDTEFVEPYQTLRQQLRIRF